MIDYAEPEANNQLAPFPHELAELVKALHYKTRWRFRLADTDRGQGSFGLTLIIEGLERLLA